MKQHAGARTIHHQLEKRPCGLKLEAVAVLAHSGRAPEQALRHFQCCLRQLHGCCVACQPLCGICCQLLGPATQQQLLRHRRTLQCLQHSDAAVTLAVIPWHPGSSGGVACQPQTLEQPQ